MERKAEREKTQTPPHQVRELQTLPVEISCLTEDTTEVRLNFQNAEVMHNNLGGKGCSCAGKGATMAACHAPSGGPK